MSSGIWAFGTCRAASLALSFVAPCNSQQLDSRLRWHEYKDIEAISLFFLLVSVFLVGFSIDQNGCGSNSSSLLKCSPPCGPLLHVWQPDRAAHLHQICSTRWAKADSEHIRFLAYCWDFTWLILWMSERNGVVPRVEIKWIHYLDSKQGAYIFVLCLVNGTEEPWQQHYCIFLSTFTYGYCYWYAETDQVNPSNGGGTKFSKYYNQIKIILSH